MFVRIATSILRFIGHWLPIAGAAGLLVHLSWLGLRPALIERQRLQDKRVQIAGESGMLAEQLDELVDLERALEDPVYQERLRWQWRLGGQTPQVLAAEGVPSRGLGTAIDALPVDAQVGADSNGDGVPLDDAAALGPARATDAAAGRGANDPPRGRIR